MCQKMGATVVAVQFASERMMVAHVGDSRVYRLRGEYLEQLTQDHSFVAEQVRAGQMSGQEANVCNLQHILTRAIGIEPEVQVDFTEELMVDGDAVLLCSDGLTRELSDIQIARILANAESAQQAADQLIHFANEAGGRDNISAIVLRRPTNTLNVSSRIGQFVKRLGGRRN